jgi:WD40 repeat protein
MAEELDYYALLAVPQDADLATIRLAFRRLARLYHPDVAGTGSLERMQQLNAAYRVLSDPELRRTYDAQRPQPVPAPNQSSPAQPPTPPRPQTAKRTGTLRHSGGPFQYLHAFAAPDAIPVAALSFSGTGAVLGAGLLDGRVQLWDMRTARSIAMLSFGSEANGGVLQDVRLSPNGTLAVAWGFQLGIRVWNVLTGQRLWHIGASAPSGALDVALFDTPAWVRLALPDAPLALSDEDPFRWAYTGRQGSGILTRPLDGPVDPAWATPIRCYEARQGNRLHGASGNEPAQWRVQQRLLSPDGRSLLTISTGRTAALPAARIVRLWDLEHRTVRGVMEPRCVAQYAQPAEYLQFPTAVTPDFALACASFQEREALLFSLRGDGKQRTIPTGPISSEAQMALAPDGRYLAIATGPRLDLYETLSGQRAQQWQCAAPISALTFGPPTDHLILAFALQNGLTELWRA